MHLNLLELCFQHHLFDTSTRPKEIFHPRTCCKSIKAPALKKMTVHSITLFDRKGKTLFTKTYSPVAAKQQRYLLESGTAEPGSDPVTEQRKLVFGMLFSLRELVGSLTPENSGQCESQLHRA
jgi:hypothetical protein